MPASKKFIELLKELPEAIYGKNDPMGGPKEIISFRSMQEIEQNIFAVAERLTDDAHPYLKIIHKEGECWECKLKKGEDPNTPYADCPHIQKGITHFPAICRSWTIDIRELQKATPAAIG